MEKMEPGTLPPPEKKISGKEGKVRGKFNELEFPLTIGMLFFTANEPQEK
jgi:hypothetical protein